MSHPSLSHLPLTTSTSSSSSTFPLTSQEHTTQVHQEHLVDDERHERTPCYGPRQSVGIIQIPTPTGYEPKSIETQIIGTEAGPEDPEDLEPKRIELDKSLQTDLRQLYQIQERSTEETYQTPITEEVEEFGKAGDKQSYIQSKIHFDYDSAESIADSDLEDGEL